MFHVHGGLVISRIVNEIGIAKKVPTAIGKPSEGGGNACCGGPLARFVLGP
jgi:hypothetical protein